VVRGADGRARRMVGATGDITEIKERECELHTAKAEAEVARSDAEQTREALQTVIDNMFDKDLRVRLINHQDKRRDHAGGRRKIKARSDYSNGSRSDDRQARCGRGRFTQDWNS
jgi:hypothetical protein